MSICPVKILSKMEGCKSEVKGGTGVNLLEKEIGVGVRERRVRRRG